MELCGHLVVFGGVVVSRWLASHSVKVESGLIDAGADVSTEGGKVQVTGVGGNDHPTVTARRGKWRLPRVGDGERLVDAHSVAQRDA